MLGGNIDCSEEHAVVGNSFFTFFIIDNFLVIQVIQPYFKS